MRTITNLALTGVLMVVASIVACLGIAVSADAADDLRQPIHVSSDHHFLAQPDGQPFFWLGDTAWLMLTRLTREEADIYLKDRAAKGFTVIQAMVMRLDPPKELHTRNRYGELVLIYDDPTRPNPRYFENVDWVVDRAAHYGLRLAMLPTWGLTYVVGGKSKIFTPANAEIYGRWIAARYRHKGVIWVLGGDLTALWAKDWTERDFTIEDHRPVFDAMAKGIMEGDGGRPFITYHPACCSWSGTAHPRTSLYFHDRAWLDMNMLQSSHFLNPEAFLSEKGLDFAWNGTFNYEPIADEYNSKPTRPVVDGEPRYERLPRSLLGPDASEVWNSYDVRNAAYHAVFAGAAGHTFGNGFIAGFAEPAVRESDKDPAVGKPLAKSWREEINSEGARTMQYLKALMLSRPYFTRIPDQSVIVGGAGEGVAHIGATRDREGSYMMIYLPQGQPVTVDMIKLSGLSAAVWWYDPRTGTATRIEGTHPTNRQQRFMPPSSGPENDWVLVLDDAGQNFPPPGEALRTRP